MAASGHHPERSEGAFTCKVKVRERERSGAPEWGPEAARRRLLKGTAERRSPTKRGGRTELGRSEGGVNLWGELFS